MIHTTPNNYLRFITFVLSLFTSITGLMSPDIYQKVVTRELLPGAFSQDLVTAIASVLGLSLIFGLKEKEVKKHSVILGLLGYLFYAYGIYVIERAYNSYYLLYMGIFSLSFWAVVYGVVCMRKEILRSTKLPHTIKNISAAGALLQPVIFYPLWIGMLLPLMRTGNQIDSLYSIFILDLCFIMPAFAILAYYTFKNHGIGLVLLPGMYILGFTLIFSLAVGEIVKPFFALSTEWPAFWQSLLLSVFFLIIGLWHLRRLVLA